MIVPVSQTATYPQASICGGFESKYTYIDPGLFNSANLTGLTPATKYFYRVGAIVSCCFSIHQDPSTTKQWDMHGSAQQCTYLIHEFSHLIAKAALFGLQLWPALLMYFAEQADRHMQHTLLKLI